MFIDLKIFSIILDVSAIFKLDAKTTFLEIFLYRALLSNLQFNEYPEYILEYYTNHTLKFYSYF